MARRRLSGGSGCLILLYVLFFFVLPSTAIGVERGTAEVLIFIGGFILVHIVIGVVVSLVVGPIVGGLWWYEDRQKKKKKRLREREQEAKRLHTLKLAEEERQKQLREQEEQRRREEEERRFRALELADVDNMGPGEFEQYVGRLMKRRGYKTKVIGKVGDMGVDVVAQNGAKKYAVQVKRYNQPVSRRAVSDAVAGKEHYACNAAMVVTNNYFTKGAMDLARSTKCQLVDRDTLADWIVGLRAETTKGRKQEGNHMRVESEELRAGVNPRFMQLGARIAAFHIEAGARSFGAYAKKMVEEFGDRVKPYLKAWYNAVRDVPEAENFRSEMTSPAKVDRLSQPEVLDAILSGEADENENGIVWRQKREVHVEDTILPMRQPMPRKQSALDILIAQQRAAATERKKKPPAQKAPAKKMAGKKRSQGEMPMTPTPPMKMKGLYLHRSPSPTSPVMPANILTPERVALVKQLNQHPLNQKARELLSRLEIPPSAAQLHILTLLWALADDPPQTMNPEWELEALLARLPRDRPQQSLDLLLGQEDGESQVIEPEIRQVNSPQALLDLLEPTLNALADPDPRQVSD